ncbi:hypothetical protein BCIN_07g00460 [Botrytis cinerea B05.10]|uniref:Uncharacterized protein n=1 Tax=Botryotinia fuckeliana (strain B05.10) TaxID=332648 RepID=A0A384JLH0_BOTFB|nr:hypothetical protein BCIN_07g00460 [Botrytis cinerea B05.10]ATZ51403.1 hypothetical protein BCIN_07g00460 [Botrytis cinerea B05.10]
MLGRKIISGSITISRSAIFLPKNSMHMRLPTRGALASTFMSREYHDDVISKSRPKMTAEEKTAVKDAEGPNIERSTEVARNKVDGKMGRSPKRGGRQLRKWMKS